VRTNNPIRLSKRLIPTQNNFNQLFSDGLDLQDHYRALYLGRVHAFVFFYG